MKIKVRLTIFEKLYLSYRGRKEAKKGFFQNYDTGELLSEVHQQRTANPRYLSSFVVTELGNFNAQRDALLERKKCFLTIEGTKRGRQAKAYHFSKAIAYIDKQIAGLEADVKLIELKYFNKISLLEEKCSIKAKRNTDHIVQLYENKIVLIRNEQYDDIIKKYESIVVLLNDKIRIIEEMEAVLNAILTRRLLRVRFYYENARRSKPNLPVAFLNEEDFLKLCDSHVLGKYEQVLKDAYEKRDVIVSEIPPKFNADVIDESELENLNTEFSDDT